MKNVGILYDIWSIIRPFLYILRPLGIFCSYLVYFPPFGKLYQEKSGNPAGGSLLSFSFCRSYFYDMSGH
jgi:hypothetical protein